MIILFILYNLFLHGDALAGPLPPLHPISIHSREIDSNKFTQRSEWSIILSCFATLFACSWVAIHPNIPAPSDSPIRIFIRRLMIMGYMLIVPEFVIGWAGRQWYAAHCIAKKHKDRKWTTTHGFFALMGGFMLYENGVMTQTLGIKKLEQLESEGKIEWPSISKKEIEDRSKGNFISKGFVVLQTTWFIVQCIARGVSRLIITELEVAILAFVVLNGILYFLWWHKPQDVTCPVSVHLCHPTTSDTTSLSSKPEPGEQTTASEYGDVPESDRQYFPIISNSSHMTLALNSGGEELSHEADPLPATEKIESTPLEPLSSTSFQHHAPSAITRFRAYFCRKFKNMGWFAPIYIFIIKPFKIFLSPVVHMVECNTIGNSLSVPTFYAPLTTEHDSGNALLIATGVGLLFGGIHCIAWSFGFLSVEEKYLWRISAVGLIVAPFTTLALCMIFAAMASVDLTNKSPVATLGYVDWIIQSVKSCFRFLCFVIDKYVGRIIVLLAFLAYLVSRVVLLILPLLALRSLSPDSLLDIKWLAFIPHI